MKYLVIDNIENDRNPFRKELQQKAKLLFVTTYTQYFLERNLGEFNANLFDQYPLIHILIDESNDLCGYALSRFFNTKSQDFESSPYIMYMPEFTRAYLKQNFTKLMSIEWLAIDPKYQKRFSKIQWGEVLTGLAIQSIDVTDADCVIGMPRVDNKTHKTSESLGARELALVNRNKTECSVRIMERGSNITHKNKYVNAEIVQKFSERQLLLDRGVENDKDGIRKAR